MSTDFPDGPVGSGLQKLRSRLLDLTNRNRLLNFRPTAASLRIVDADIDATFTALIDGDQLLFEPVPEPEGEPERELGLETPLLLETPEVAQEAAKPTAEEHARRLGWSTSYDLEAGGSRPWRTLRVLHYSEKLDVLSRKIASAANTAIQESGTNILHLILGFIEWYESEDSDQPRLAPLVVIPAALDRNAGRGKGFACAVEHSGEDLAVNESLIEKLRADFGVELPQMAEDEQPEAYFRRIEPVVAQKRRWRVRRQMTLSLLSFGKLLMYRDLDPAVWQGLTDHPTIKEIFEGRTVATIGPAPDYAIDDLEQKREFVPQVVLDADASQHSALIDALRGQNLVIEGPPGTGKSQTIANLIAAALANGKTVLFVAEKLAALEVVRRRLDEAGLGLFCLELHSHKTRKDALLKELAERVQARGGRGDSDSLDAQLRSVATKKKAIARYAALLQSRHETFGATLQELIWSREQSLIQCGTSCPSVEDLYLPAVMHYRPSQMAEAEQGLAEYAEHLTILLIDRLQVEDHPWSWVKAGLTFEDEERLIGLLRQVQSSVRLVEEGRQGLSAMGIDVAETLDALKACGGLLSGLPEMPPLIDPRLLSICRERELREALIRLAADVGAARNQRSRLALATERGDPEPLLGAEAQARAERLLAVARECGLDGQALAGLTERVANLARAEGSLVAVEASCSRVAATTGVSPPSDTRGIRTVLATVSAIEAAPVDALHLRSVGMEADGAAREVGNAATQAAELKARRAELGKQSDLSAAAEHGSSLLKRLAGVLDHSPIWQRLFGRDFRQARRVSREIATVAERKSRHEIARRFRELAEHLDALDRFLANPHFRGILGPGFSAGLDCDWPGLVRVATWYESVFGSVPGLDENSAGLRALVFQQRADVLRSVRDQIALLTVDRRVLSEFASARASDPAGAVDQPVHALLTAARSQRDQVEDLIRGAGALGLAPTVPLSALPDLLSQARDYREALSRIESNQLARSALDGSLDGADTNVELVVPTVGFAAAVCEALPAAVRDLILSTGSGAALDQLRDLLGDVLRRSEQLAETFSVVDAVAGCHEWRDGGRGIQASAERARALVNRRDDLLQWQHFLRSQAWVLQAGLKTLGELAAGGHIPASDIVPAFRFVFYSTLVRGMSFDLAGFDGLSGVGQEQLRQQFIDADRKAIEHYRRYAADQIGRRLIPAGNGTGPVRTWTELSLINQELSKQKRHIPIRQLVRRSGRALQAMKPCFMMGPLSVAQYLAPRHLQFDLVVMDEASQLKPEDAIGAIARGKQVVVVGDPKQLPPSNFFERVVTDQQAEEEETTGAEEAESILDVATARYQPVRRLRWHYRSRHHSLIAYSNREFYEGDLMVFPSAVDRHAELGVTYRQVSRGCFENRRNPVEAAEVVSAVMDHMRSRFEESLGVVTLNFDQRELLEEMLDRQCREDPAAIAYQERMEQRGEPFFVKNLENVQGDERDVVFVSGTYGPDAGGAQHQRFGPITGVNGHRRLNVLFTRAKNRVVVFSSLDPDRIRTHGASRGVRVLKEYLTFARTGTLPQSVRDGDGPTNDFERSVGGILQSRGYDVAYQVGVAGFFIDVAIRNPAKPGIYVLGIECDGAAFHSSRSARDRDRLRQEILESRGWRIHRVWSTDWYKARTKEIDRLLARVERALSDDPDYQQHRQSQVRLESIRVRLVELREGEIGRAFPETPGGQCLLRDELLDLFVEKRPTTREDWFRVVPYELRAATEAAQVGQFLDRVLGIIRELAD